MAKVAAYIIHDNSLSKKVVTPMVVGAEAYGDEVDTMTDKNFSPGQEDLYDTAIFWGYIQTCQNIMAAYKAAGKSAVYLDLAYWERMTHYKVSVNDRHPTAYFQDLRHDDVRRKRFGVEPQPYTKRGDHILIAGMSAKAAWAEKLEPAGSWETAAIAELKKYTDRKIIYRPKPSWAGATPLPGSGYSVREPLEKVLADAWAVVTHHSNTAVEGLVLGVPAFTKAGVAKPMSLSDLSAIEKPLYPAEREKWLNDVAYTQWSLVEMRSGIVWRHLKEEGLIA